jgi:hypothetical protein
MAHFAKIGVNGKVIAVHSYDNNKMLNADNVEDESVAQQELERIHGWPAEMWIQTSYNTRCNKYYNADGTEGDVANALRGNYAGIGYTWDEDNNIFWPKKPHTSSTKNITTASWDSPITYPSITQEGSDPIVYFKISWDETLYESNNSKGWIATKSDDTAETPTVWDWNGSAWISR